jgi:Mrp family chromosome partitioning ATPase
MNIAPNGLISVAEVSSEIPDADYSRLYDEDGFAGRVDPAKPAEISLPVISAASLAGKEVPARWWIIPGMIPDRTVTIVSGDGGVGKSLLLAQLAVAVATAAPSIDCDRSFSTR